MKRLLIVLLLLFPCWPCPCVSRKSTAGKSSSRGKHSLTMVDRDLEMLGRQVTLIIAVPVGLGAVLVTRMGTRTYALGKVSVAVVGDEQRPVSAADPVTR
jgi:hypothetical protein